ncbi:hypothetical protein F0Q45_21790 [Mycobacterium simiae]|uniref:Uncharacterized protein n=1 Tax=Mycobacterium simiae TaxID=1784 RepID=A0A5B1BL56_MYCSI|nr:hypothetical protein [Mycobacterium simiae]KAA1248230.1 hypothetical protein F0Q45_21790 [Mycobacterium simiae]
MALLAALDEQLAVVAQAAGAPPGKALSWSADEAALLEAIAETVDRKVDLRIRYSANADFQAALKLSAELRLLDSTLARLLKQVKPVMPTVPKTQRSQKASHAAKTRWERDAALGK